MEPRGVISGPSSLNLPGLESWQSCFFFRATETDKNVVMQLCSPAALMTQGPAAARTRLRQCMSATGKARKYDPDFSLQELHVGFEVLRLIISFVLHEQ